MEQRPPSVPKLAWVKEEEGAGAAPVQQPEEVEQFQLLQEDAGMDRTQEQDPTRGRFRRAAQMVCRFIRMILHEETTGLGTGVLANFHLFSAETSAAILDMLVEKGVPDPKQVPAMVRYIHWWLRANDSAEHRLDKALLELTEEHPLDVLMTLLRWAPSCDRAAEAMWRTIMSFSGTAELALQLLLDVLRTWPADRVYTSDGDDTGVFALAATMALWKIFSLTWCPQVVMVYFPQLFLRLLFQVFVSTLDMPEEVDTFWKSCQEQHGLATNPNSFAVQTLKALLCRLKCEQVVLEMERKCGWDTLLSADTHHYAVGLLAREMRRASRPLCSEIVLHLLGVVNRGDPRWDLPAMAFLVEGLECLDSSKYRDIVVEVSSRHLQSESREMRRLALKAMLEFMDDLSMAEKMRTLTERLVDLLQDTDGETVGMTIIALSLIFLDKDTVIPSPMALQLADALLPLFDNENSQVQLLSMMLFREMKDFLEEGKKPFKTPVHQSLLPLFFHCHDENQRVAEASQETLLSAVRFLKRRDIEKLLKKKALWNFGECLLEKDRSRAAEYLRQALPYLQSPQEPLREAAVRFIGIAGRYLKGQQQELQIVYKALENMTDDISLGISNLALQTLYVLLALENAPYSRFQKVQDQLRQLWKTRPSLWGRGWLSCWSAVEN